ncbi:hypothetical protein [Rubritalea sp.]|uniref:hypothetical protein n=1 Tax=Rubritalea sp. TaxID=2109375 RepID=UPI003EF204B9
MLLKDSAIILLATSLVSCSWNIPHTDEYSTKAHQKNSRDKADFYYLSSVGKLDTWISNTREPFQIIHDDALSSGLRYFISTDKEVAKLRAQLRTSDSMWQFGQEEDPQHAIVAFDEGRNQTYIYPEKYAQN